jgi:hypothetical protein
VGLGIAGAAERVVAQLVGEDVDDIWPLTHGVEKT